MEDPRGGVADGGISLRELWRAVGDASFPTQNKPQKIQDPGSFVFGAAYSGVCGVVCLLRIIPENM